MNKLGGRKFLMALLGIVLCVIWAATQWDEKFLVTALGFVGVFTAGNILDNGTGNKK